MSTFEQFGRLFEDNYLAFSHRQLVPNVDLSKETPRYVWSYVPVSVRSSGKAVWKDSTIHPVTYQPLSSARNVTCDFTGADESVGTKFFVLE